MRELPRSAVPVERVRDEHPDSEEWRADALAKSRHARLADELVEPLEDHDPRNAARVCAEVTRAALGDFAPALILLPVAARERVQALAAYTLTLFDFARQTGVEGERLAALNRWEFTLEAALSGSPAGQPVFVRMAVEEERRPWPREPLDALADAARSRAVRARPRTDRELETDADALARALCGALEASAEATMLAGALRAASLQLLGEQLRRRAPALPVDELPEPPPGESFDPTALVNAIATECQRIQALLASQAAAPQSHRKAWRYVARCVTHLTRRITALGPEVVFHPPHVGLARRVWWLLTSR